MSAPVFDILAVWNPLALLEPVWKFVWYFQLVGMLAVAGWVATALLLGRLFGWRTVGCALGLGLLVWGTAVVAYSSCHAAGGIQTESVNYWTIRVSVGVLVVALLMSLRRDRRVVPYRAIGAVGLLTLAFAGMNSASIDNIQIDDARAREERAKLAEAQEGGRTNVVARAADDIAMPAQLDERLRQKKDEAMRRRLRGETNETEEAEAPAAATNGTASAAGTNDTRSIYERAAAGEAAADGEPVPLYRQGGKKQRAAGKTEKQKDLARAVAREDGSLTGRRMNERDRYRAVACNKTNLACVRIALMTAALTLLLSYLSRFNRTFAFLCPLPIAGPPIDRFFGKSHAVAWTRPEPGHVRGFLRAAVRKGETFIYLGDADPIRGETRLVRFHVCSLVEFARALWAFACEVWDALRRYGDGPRPSVPAMGTAKWTKRALQAAENASRVCVRDFIRYAGLAYAFLRRHAVRMWRLTRAAAHSAGAQYPLSPAAVALVRAWVARVAPALARARVWGDAAPAAGESAAPSLGARAAAAVGPAVRLAVRAVLWWRTRTLSREDPVHPGTVTRLLRFARTASVFVQALPRRVLFTGFDFTLRKRQYDEANRPTSSEFVFESAWFGRYCFSVAGSGLSRELLRDLVVFLDSRSKPKANVRRTVNVVWALREPIGDEVMEELTRRCRQENFRLLVLGGEGLSPSPARWCEEVVRRVPPEDVMALERLDAAPA